MAHWLIIGFSYYKLPFFFFVPEIFIYLEFSLKFFFFFIIIIISSSSSCWRSLQNQFINFLINSKIFFLFWYCVLYTQTSFDELFLDFIILVDGTRIYKVIKSNSIFKIFFYMYFTRKLQSIFKYYTIFMNINKKSNIQFFFPWFPPNDDGKL